MRSNTAWPPFMSADPSPNSVSPSTRGASLPLAGTVSRWPPSRTRRSVRAECARRVVATRSIAATARAHEGGPRPDRRARPRRGSPTAPRTKAVVSSKRSSAGLQDICRRGCSRRAPSRGRMSLSVALSCAPPLRQALDHEPHGIRTTAGEGRGRVAEMATLQSGTMPRDNSSPVSASITGIVPERMSPAPSTTPLPTRRPRRRCSVSR